MSKTFDTIKKEQVFLNEGLSRKVDSKEVVQIHQQLGRFAVYEDYKSLYAKVIPCVSEMQKTVASCNKQVTQFEAIIQRLDLNMQQRALKTEVNEMLVLLKKYTKNSAFHKTVKEMAESITENETEVEKL